jgi:hypothetical protein
MTDITHRRVAVGAPRTALQWALRSIATALRELTLDERTRFFSRARDHADLKRRMEIWDAREPRSTPWTLLR